MEMYTKRQLFGGAISCEIPSTWRDVSDIRQVPDHQEVWQEMDGAVLVVEILQRQEVDDANAASFFFTDLAEANGIIGQSNDAIFYPSPVPTANQMQISNGTACSGMGYQKIAKGRDYDIAGNRRTDQTIQWTRIELCVLRLEHVETDLLITISRPCNGPQSGEGTPSWSTEYQRIVSSFNIHDWSLFG